jgi:hypothetical protein
VFCLGNYTFYDFAPFFRLFLKATKTSNIPNVKSIKLC